MSPQTYPASSGTSPFPQPAVYPVSAGATPSPALAACFASFTAKPWFDSNDRVNLIQVNAFVRHCAAANADIVEVSEYAQHHFTDREYKAKDIKLLVGTYHEMWQREQENSLKSWPSLQPLSSTLAPVAPFREELFPAPLRPALADLAYRMQCPPDWLASAFLVAIGSTIGARCGIHPKQHDTSWVEVPNLWGAIVAEPSKMKTPALKAAFAELSRLEKEAQATHEQASKQHEAQAEVLKIRKDALRQQIKAAAKENNLDQLAELTANLAALEAESAPTARRYIVNDATVEKLTELLSAPACGLLAFRDELTGLFHTWERPGHENDRAFYLEAWTGTGRYTSDRIGRGTTSVDHCCISMFGGIQPDKLEPYRAQALNGQNDGMLQRFQMLTWPDAHPYRYVDVAPDAAAQAQARELFRRIATMDFIAEGATLDDGGTIPCFHFTEEAQAAFIDWLNRQDARLKSADEPPAFIQHLAKYRKLLPALALLFHLIDLAEGIGQGAVSLRAVQLAEQWCLYLETHARRLYSYKPGKYGAGALAVKLREKALTAPFKARDVYRREWHGLASPKEAQQAIDELVEANWLRVQPVPTPPSPAGGRPALPLYEINPRIHLA